MSSTTGDRSDATVLEDKRRVARYAAILALGSGTAPHGDAVRMR